MTIETKFSIGDTIYFLYYNKIMKGTIKSIKLKVTDISQAIKINYEVQETEYHLHFEEDLYSSREELIKNL